MPQASGLGQGHGPDFEELRELLRSWNATELLSHFQDEAINVEELQMIKRHHLDELLRHFRFGTRIRFEHHLERWRRWLNVPLQGPFGGGHCTGCRCTESDLRSPACQPQITSARSIVEPVSLASKLDESVKGLPSEPLVSLNEAGESTSFHMALPLTDHTELVHTSSLKQERDCSEQDMAEEGGVTVLGILQSSGPKAQALLEHLGQNEQLDAVQRLLLIQLICSYYEDNHLHLTLQRSHLLEREILELFPKEQLHYYRTERRGKIYVRFTNMKRNKRFNAQRGIEPKRRKEEPQVPKPMANISFVSKGVSFTGETMSSPERSD